jgi:hypothetical protein
MEGDRRRLLQGIKNSQFNGVSFRALTIEGSQPFSVDSGLTADALE